MKKCLTIVVAMMIPLFLFGQSYSALWHKVEQAENKDLPKTAYEELQKIVGKATKDKAYGQLLKAELRSAQVMTLIAPDSLKPAIVRLQQRCDGLEDGVLKTVYQTVLYRICSDNRSLGIPAQKPMLTEKLCQQLAQEKDKSYAPFVVNGIDSEIFHHDLLSVVGYELDDYHTLYDYYAKVGNRRAACILASKIYGAFSEAKLDSLMEVYGDLPEAGELAIRRILSKGCYSDSDRAERLRLIRQALKRWGSWPRMETLRNEEKTLTNPQFEVSFEHPVVRPGQTQKVALKSIRNLSSLTMRIYKVKADGAMELSPTYEKGYKKVEPLLDGIASEVVRTYSGKADYEFFGDSITMEALPVGVYMVEFASNPNTDSVRMMLYVTDVCIISEPQPSDDGIRYVVVNATTGQPIPEAHLRIRNYQSYSVFDETKAVADRQGEYFFRYKNDSYRREVFAYTNTDKACPMQDDRGSYYFDKDIKTVYRTCIFTDRAIYRPGQTVHASLLRYKVENGIQQSVVPGETVTVMLRDANRKVIEEKTVETDAYGVCTVDMTLPSTGLTGLFTLESDGTRQTVRVEEYKRPTFHVDFPEVKQLYAAGDTIKVKGTAMSYAGVPVQGAKVSYKVVRRTAFWWWSYSRYWQTTTIGYDNNGETIFTSDTETDNDGQFEVQMPFTMPETSYPMFYHFVVMADVTDNAGETHSGELSLPLGNRKQALRIDMADKILLEQNPTVTFHLLNAAGQDIETEVRYQIDGGDWQTAKTNSNVSLADAQLKHGRHQLKAVWEDQTEERDFVLFSLDDTTPPAETDDWFYQSATRFPDANSPITIQVGSSDKDVHIFYSIFAGDKVIKRGAVDKTNQLINLKLTYEEAYENGLLLTFAWVKNGRVYKHEASVERPMPDKRLLLEWSTFRDRLTPGQQEEWTLTVKDADGKPVDAQLMATLYDQSLDQLTSHRWPFTPYLSLSLPSTYWRYAIRSNVTGTARMSWRSGDVPELKFSMFDKEVFPSPYYHNFRRFSRGAVLGGHRVLEVMPMAEVMVEKAVYAKEEAADNAMEAKAVGEPREESQNGEVQMRENLNETAFFYPQLMTDNQGKITMKFTLPESLTTWRLLGLAHTKDLCYGNIEATAIAQKDVMIQPNMPRFLRDGDHGTVSARIFNTSERTLSGKALMKLTDPETNAIVYEQTKPVVLKPGETTTVIFDYTPDDVHNLLVCQMSVSGKGFSDGEQHYLPILPSTERVTMSRAITQHHAGVSTVDLGALLPADSKNQRLVFEYTNNPAWLMIQALPTVGMPDGENAISQAAAYYANVLGKHILDKNPQAKTAFALWKQEKGSETSLTSQLEKNQDLKSLVLSETPWVADADRETEQKQRLADFFDENLMQNRIGSTIDKLKLLQLGDGSWTWWKGMPGSFYMTVAVTEMLVRMNTMVGKQQQTEKMLSSAFHFMGNEAVEEVNEMKRLEKKGFRQSFPSFKMLEWLYIVTLDGRELPQKVQDANNYLLNLLKKEVKNQSIYEKALTAVILSKTDTKRAQEYAQSLKEYTVFREDMGRYYDTPRAGYSWYDYKIPTQTMAIEALQLLSSEDAQTIEEMQRWLLQEKRTQAWDTPINSVNAVYAFLKGGSLTLGQQQAIVKVDNKPLETSHATAALGYVKTAVPTTSRKLTVEKTAEGTSWGAVYAQFTQATNRIADNGNGLTVKRELIGEGRSVGNRVKVRITITADRDYDFVQVVDKRAACLEPVSQLSGYYHGSYCAPKDNATYYYFDCLSKGTHVIEKEYYIDRPGIYETGTCTVECAYSPEFRATTKSQTLTIE